MSGTLYVVSTPIGNLRDMTYRAVDVLESVDEWVVEDSRRAGKLRSEFEIPNKTMNRYYDENETRRTPELLDKLRNGSSLAHIVDAGTPVISDPGYELIHEAREREIDVIPIPGVNAPIAALSVSGFPSHEFVFIGFFPRNEQSRRNTLLELKYFEGTVIFFESPNRILYTLEAIRTYLGSRDLFIGREMTKQHEEYMTGTPNEFIDRFSESDPQGELTVLIRPGDEESVEPEDYLRELLKKGLKLTDAAKAAAKFSEQSRSELYKIGVSIQDEFDD